jgi:hypothetical protein
VWQLLLGRDGGGICGVGSGRGGVKKIVFALLWPTTPTTTTTK